LVTIWKETLTEVLEHIQNGSSQEARNSIQHLMYITATSIFRSDGYIIYLRQNLLDLIVRILCFICLVQAMTYEETNLVEEERMYQIQPEAFLSITATLLWIRKLKVLVVFRTTGSFIYMLGALTQDVAKWLIIYLLGVVAFGTGISVLYRNQIMDSGFLLRPYNEVGFSGEECAHFDLASHEWTRMLSLIIQITFDGASYWNCHYYSRTPLAGLMIHSGFLIFVTMVLVNALIAMMAETFSRVQHESFENYAYGFANILLVWTQEEQAPVPLNLMSLPYNATRVLSHVPFIFKVARLIVGAFLKGAAEVGGGHVRSLEQLQQASSAAPAKGDSLRQIPFGLLRQVSVPVHLEKGKSQDLALMAEIGSIRENIIRRKKPHFERSIAFYCQAQEEGDDPPNLEEIREAVQDLLRSFIVENESLEGRLRT